MSGSQPLKGLLVVSMDQAVAAPYCASRLADAGARVIKLERPEGDFARGYDRAANGLSSYFVWLNRGKESLCIDFRRPDDKALMERLVAKADIFIQNLAPGAMARAGFGSAALREKHPRLITVDISGYGEEGEGRLRIWVTTPFDKNPATAGNGSMLAFTAESRAAVDRFHAAALANGGRDEGKPGLRPYGENFYACYVRDPDGNKLSAVCQQTG